MDQWAGWRRKGSALLTQEKGYYELPRKLRVEASYGFSMRMVKGKAFLKYPKATRWLGFFFFFFFLINGENKDLFPGAISWAIFPWGQGPCSGWMEPTQRGSGDGICVHQHAFLEPGHQWTIKSPHNILRLPYVFDWFFPVGNERKAAAIEKTCSLHDPSLASGVMLIFRTDRKVRIIPGFNGQPTSGSAWSWQWMGVKEAGEPEVTYRLFHSLLNILLCQFPFHKRRWIHI